MLLKVQNLKNLKQSYSKVALINPNQNFNYLNNQLLSYSIPSELNGLCKLGSLVLVPFGKQKQNGIIVEISQELKDEEKTFKLKDIEELVSESPICNEDLIELVSFTAKYYSCHLSDVWASIITQGIIKKPEKIIELNIPKENLSDKDLEKTLIKALLRARKHSAKFSRLQTLSGLNKDELNKSIRDLISKSIITVKYSSPSSLKEKNQKNFLDKFDEMNSETRFQLNDEQNNVYSKISKKLGSKFLIHGITGSGKTEIYLRLIEDEIKKSKSSLILVPEIALAPQLIEKVSKRFGADRVLIWHSALSGSEKEFSWKSIIKNPEKAFVVIGARSAIFTPLKNLGLIIIDEEHENSYKQENPDPRYHARTLAEKRAELLGATLVLGSATPSIESYFKATNKNFSDWNLLKLKKRALDSVLPQVHVVDMRIEFSNGNKSIFSRLLEKKIQEALKNNEQVILFLNKRGSASHVFCRTCGYVYNCRNCDSKMVYHSDKNLLICHHCNHSEAHPESCPSCGMNTIKFFGLGTQKLEQETIKNFPEARIARLDSDVSRSQDNYLKIWNSFKKHEIDILIGTQMIAKGLDIEKLTTVGVISADSSFSQLDHCAEERSFQLLTQVAGRAGRREKEGIVIYQSYQSDREVLLESQEQNYEKFYFREIKNREEFSYPPFSSLIRFISSSENEAHAIKNANNFHKIIYEAFSDKSDLKILGPSPCVLSKLKNRYRYHLLIKILKYNHHHDFNASYDKNVNKLKDLYIKFKPLEGSRFLIDIDSQSLY